MTRPEIWPASGNVAMTGRGDTWLVVLLAPLSAILALAIFGPIWSPDTGGYVEYAQQILLGTIPSGEALLHGGPEPISLFRAPGYPALLAGLQWLFPDAWRSALVMLQIAATTVIAAATHRTALRLGAGRVAAIAAALLPATGFAVVMQIAILTDALNAVLFTGAALALAAWRGATMAVARAKYRPALYDDERHRARAAPAQTRPAAQQPAATVVARGSFGTRR